MTAAWVDVQLWRYSALPNEGWDRALWDEGHWDAGYPTPNVEWLSIVCDVRGLDLRRGSQGTIVAGGSETGVLMLELDNRDGQWSEFVDTGDGNFEPALTNGVQLRVIAGNDVVPQVTLFRGWVEAWVQRWTKTDDSVLVTCTDGWSDLVQQGSDVEWTPGAMGEQVGERLWRLVRMRAGWDEDQYPIYLQPGSVRLLGSSAWGSVERGLTLRRTSVADEILRTTRSDGGIAFLDGDGAFVYLNRGRWSSIASAPSHEQGRAPRPAQGTVPLFGDWCGTPQSNELPYTDLEWDYDGTGAANIVVVANADAPHERDDAGNVIPDAWAQCGSTQVDGRASNRRRQVLQLTDLRFTTQAEADALATHYLNTYAEKFVSVRRLEVRPELDDRLWATVLGLRLQDHVRVLRRTQTNTVDMECLIDGAQYRITPLEVVNGLHYGTWIVTYSTTDAVSEVSDLGVRAKHFAEVAA